jgi:phosphoribosyl-dephospho-CoA transferase
VNHYRVHDLLRIGDDAVGLLAHAPTWVAESLNRTPWVVVRRANAPLGHIPVGVRGTTRAHRYALTVPHTVVRQHVTPEQIGHSRIRHRDGLPAMATLSALRARLSGEPLRWGPTGSVGFELASRSPCVTGSSDLDIAVFVHGPASPALATLATALSGLPARVDCSVELPSGAVALTELLGDAEQLLLKGPDGPRLILRRDLPT